MESKNQLANRTKEAKGPGLIAAARADPRELIGNTMPTEVVVCFVLCCMSHSLVHGPWRPLVSQHGDVLKSSLPGLGLGLEGNWRSLSQSR